MTITTLRTIAVLGRYAPGGVSLGSTPTHRVVEQRGRDSFRRRGNGRIKTARERSESVPVRGGSEVPVAESAPAPPGPIPNPVVTRRSAGEYCGGDPAGGEAAAVTSDPPRSIVDSAGSVFAAGWSSGSSLGS